MGQAALHTTKLCPYCAEEIKAEAIVCKHCGKSLTKSTGNGIGGALLTILGLLMIVIPFILGYEGYLISQSMVCWGLGLIVTIYGITLLVKSI